jgi:hypothetical protein
MTLGSSRDADGEYPDRPDLTTCGACPQHALACWGGGPDERGDDRTQTGVTHARGPRRERPPAALAVAGPSGCPSQRGLPRHPAAQGQGATPGETLRAWCFCGRPGGARRELKAHWHVWQAEAWRPHRHHTTGTTIAARLAADQAALRPMPLQPEDVGAQTTRQGGTDGRVSVEGAWSSAPAACAGQRLARRLVPDRRWR